MTKAIEKKEKENLDFCRETIALKSNLERTYLELGRRLFKIREQRLFEPYYDSFNEYCMELKLSHSTVNKLVNIYKKFILEFGFSPMRLMRAGGWTVVAETLPVVRTKADADEFLEKAERLSLADMRRELKEKKLGIDQRKCEHKDIYDLRICRTCGSRDVLQDTRKK